VLEFDRKIKIFTTLIKESGYTLEREFLQKSKYFHSHIYDLNNNYKFSVFFSQEKKYIELYYEYTFSLALLQLIESNIKNVFSLCYEYGCYAKIKKIYIKNDLYLQISVNTKLYFSGLNYFSFNECIEDFIKVLDSLTYLFNDLLNYNG